MLQAGARAEQRAIAAKGLTGPGYDGHTFWDTESFVLPVLTYTLPGSVADALRWRHTRWRRRNSGPSSSGCSGAAFPWRTIAGEECSGYWPAGTGAFHINADIADAVIRYYAATEDEAFALDCGLELVVNTARLWRSLGHHDSQGAFRIDGVTGPDEYSAIADNNVYTNLLAQRNLRDAAAAADRHREPAAALGVDDEETASWRDAAESMLIPYDEALGVHPQAERFTEHQVWDFESTSPDQYPMLLHFPYFDLYRKQVVKQADLVLAMYVRGDYFSDEQKLRNFAYYERLTVRDSSLSACTQAVVAAEVGHLDLAYRYWREAARMDLDDLEHNTRDGVHIASLAGVWIAAVAGFGGLRDHNQQLSFKPRLPEQIPRLTFRVTFRGSRLKVTIEPHQATYQLLDGEPIELSHYGELLTVKRRKVRRIPPAPKLDPPTQPPGREPPLYDLERRQPVRAGADLAVGSLRGQRQLVRAIEAQLGDPPIVAPDHDGALVRAVTDAVLHLVGRLHLRDPHAGLGMPLVGHRVRGAVHPGHELDERGPDVVDPLGRSAVGPQQGRARSEQRHQRVDVERVERIDDGGDR